MRMSKGDCGRAGGSDCEDCMAIRAMYERSVNPRQAWQKDEDVAQGATCTAAAL
jgi:hypothetical protein